MKVLHIISSGGMYGAETVILNLSRALNQGGAHSSTLGVFSNSLNPRVQLHELAMKEGIESHLIACEGQMDRSVMVDIRRLAERTGADIVHAHGYKADVYAYLALRRSGTPLVSTCHNWIKQNPMVSFYGVVDRLVLRKYARVVAVSVEVSNRLLGAGVKQENIALISNGIDLRRFDKAVASLRTSEPREAGLIVGWVGRLSKEKGADIFVRAAGRVLMELPGVRFVIVGEGPEQNSLQSLIDELEIQRNVSLLGRRDDMPSVYASLDLLVSSSRQEGLPMAILEGMASRLPWVATAVGDVPNVVIDGRTGVLVPAEDVERLAAGIQRLLRDPLERLRFGTEARALVEGEFSAERMMAGYLRVYREAVAPAGSGKTVPLEEHDGEAG